MATARKRPRKPWSVPARRLPAYRAMRRDGLTHAYAARVAVKGRTKRARAVMARKGNRTRKAQG